MNEPERLSDFADIDAIDPILRAYFKAKVIIYYRESQYSDTGRLTYMDETWVELTKNNGERFLVPHSGIRIIKMLELAKTPDEAQNLLRPYGGEPPKQIKP